jgi:hypothetical protein
MVRIGLFNSIFLTCHYRSSWEKPEELKFGIFFFPRMDRNRADEKKFPVFSLTWPGRLFRLFHSRLHIKTPSIPWYFKWLLPSIFPIRTLVKTQPIPYAYYTPRPSLQPNDILWRYKSWNSSLTNFSSPTLFLSPSPVCLKTALSTPHNTKNNDFRFYFRGSVLDTSRLDVIVSLAGVVLCIWLDWMSPILQRFFNLYVTRAPTEVRR